MSSLKGFDTNKLKDRNYKGDDFNVNPELGKGPFQNRRCTDMLCCILFTVFLGGMGFCTLYGFSNGNPGMLIAPIDGDKRVCGYSEDITTATGGAYDFTDYPYLFIGNIHDAMENMDDTFLYGVCVKECPVNRDDTIECMTTTRI